MVAYIATESTITVILDGKYRTIQVKSKAHRNDVIKALEKYKKSKQTKIDKESIEAFLAPIKRIGLESDNRLELDESENKLYLKGTTQAIEPGLADKILDFLDNGLPIEPLIKFWESCLRNPHFVAVTELFAFLERNDLPITDDGAVLGYKKLNFTGRTHLPENFHELFVDPKGKIRRITGEEVDGKTALDYLTFIDAINNPDMVDVHSGTIHQKVGGIVKIDRVKFGELERRQACGDGLHVGAFGYGFPGNVRVMVKVLPEDVIACNPHEQKLRTCKYQIITFVESEKEVKELLVNLGEAGKQVAKSSKEEQNLFEEGETVVATQSLYDSEGGESVITKDNYYYITLVEDEDICVIDDRGEEVWYHHSSFEAR